MVPSSRSMLNVEFHMVLKHLKVDQLPNIDFKKLLIRFCDELQLPSDYYFSTNTFYLLFLLLY